MTQSSLFDDRPLIAGLHYRADFLSPEEEADLIARFTSLEFARVEMRGAIARRRVAIFGWTGGYYDERRGHGVPLPDFLLPVRDRLADWLGVPGERLAEALVTEYPAGAPIGWHRDAPMFDEIGGVSLGSAARMKFRPYVSPADVKPGAPPRRTTHELVLAPRSAYLLTGVVRQEYEHSIPPVAALRYSMTFRTRRV